jgi:glycine/D-amino acid oxidase-like deaminating enzyme
MKNILIVGFGLAGLSVAHHAEELGLDFDIINNNSQKSSRVAGGLLNPVAIKRMKPVWKVEEFLPYAQSYYKWLQNKFSSSVFMDRDIKVFIHHTYSENSWYEALDKVRLKSHLSKSVTTNNEASHNITKYGLVSGHQVFLPQLFQSAKEYYQHKHSFQNDTFTHDLIKINNDKLIYNSQSYEHIIFCEGYGVSQNPYFNNLGIYGNKGDYLIIRSKDLQTSDILKSKYFLIPLGNNLYKFGATYQRQPLNHIPSEDAKKEMLEALEKMINVPFEVIDQVCGIRPTTKDRKPILGTHQTHKNLHIFNGFGSRGVMTSPLLGKQLIEYIINGVELSKEISINRLYAQT